MMRIVCIDDDVSWMTALERFVEYHLEFHCVLKANSIDEFIESFNNKDEIDIILLDISLGNTNSLDHIQKIKALVPSAKIIVMTGHQEKEYLIKALQEGANSYYLKNSSPTQLIDTIIATHEGGTFIDPNAATGLVEFFQDKKNEATETAFSREDIKKQWSLTYRELQVAEGLFFEKTYKEIAREHTIAIDTVRHYLKSLYKKMQVHNRSQLIRKIRESTFTKN